MPRQVREGWQQLDQYGEGLLDQRDAQCHWLARCTGGRALRQLAEPPPRARGAGRRAAQAHDFKMTFNNGYETVIGERGMTLSGGQRQRLALARAFLTNPHILVLDDSTSAIDSATEDQIQSAIRRAARGRTTFLITHRLSQIRWADLIEVLQRGRVTAVGDHSQLLKTSPAYRQIFSRHSRWEQPDREES